MIPYCIIKRSHSLTNCQLVSLRKLYSETKEWPITCTFDPGCLFTWIKSVEAKWKPVLESVNQSNCSNGENYDKYILSMFPYPSGNLHLGHVKIYTSSDILSRYYRLKGHKVINPMGWDSFGLPAENAAIQNNLNPKDWTYSNIKTMKSQLESLGLSISWREATSDSSFYKWTQWLAVQLMRHNLLYKSMGVVNWDPIDQTVLANDQVDENGQSWRSGATVEKRFLSQWFIKTSAFAKDIYEGVGVNKGIDGVHFDHVLNIQRNWIGNLDGYVFYLKTNDSNVLPIFTDRPEYFLGPGVRIVVGPGHWLEQLIAEKGSILVKNPFTGGSIKVINASSDERLISKPIPTGFNATLITEMKGVKFEESLRKSVFLFCHKNPAIGGYKSSSTYFDWLVSRQRYWGCPIPIVKCQFCGMVPVDEINLPVSLPNVDTINTSESINQSDSGEIKSRLKEVAPKSWLHCTCPKCGAPDAERETDTFDTFVDSSWYYLRYGLPASSFTPNDQSTTSSSVSAKDQPFDTNQKQVSVYLGGPEHAIGHLSQSRFIFHFLKKFGYLKVDHSEPFEKLLLMGVITAKTYKLNTDHGYISEEKFNQLIRDKKVNRKDVKIVYEKMSKSKGNGVNPEALIDTFGTDATRLCVLGTGSPASDRLWRGTETEMKEVTKFLRKLILTVDQFIYARQLANEDKFAPIVKRFSLKKAKDTKLINAKLISGQQTENELIKEAINELKKERNETIQMATICYEHSLKLGRASKKLQSLLELMRRYSLVKEIAMSDEYEKCLGDFLILISPIIPHITNECWEAFRTYCNRSSTNYNLDKSVNEQLVPVLDEDFVVPISVLLDGQLLTRIKVGIPVIFDDEISEIVINELKKSHPLISGENIEGIIAIKGLQAIVKLKSLNVESLKEITRKKKEEENKKKKKKDESDEDEI